MALGRGYYKGREGGARTVVRWRILKFYKYVPHEQEGKYTRVLIDVVVLPPDINIGSPIGADEEFEVDSEWVD